MQKILTIITDVRKLKMASKPANAAQKQWMKNICEFVDQYSLGSIYGIEYDRSNYELHHVLGRSAKHNKVAIGNWFIIPVPFELHNVMSDHPDNVTHFKHNFTKRFGYQRNIFDEIRNGIQVLRGKPVPSEEIYNAIMDTMA